MTFKTYHRKPKTVQAVKWTAKNPHPSVQTRAPRIVLSVDKKFYYIEHLDKPGFCWLSHLAIPGVVSERKQRDKLNGWVQFSQEDGTDVYHRKMVPFVKTDLQPDLNPAIPEPILIEDSRVLLDYAYANNWEDANLETTSGIIEIDGKLRIVADGDYLVEEPGKGITSCVKSVFEEHYETS